jgi:hypothetical protein
MQEESDADLAEKAIPASLKMLEGLDKEDPENIWILQKLAEGFCGYATGGVLKSKKKFKKLPPAYQEALQKIGSERFAELAAVIQEDNLKTPKALESNGVKWTPQPEPAALKQFQ